MRSSEWSNMLLNYGDTITFAGRVRKLKADSIGFGIVEVYKEKL